MAKTFISNASLNTMPLFDLATYTTDFSWRHILLASKSEIDHIEKMLYKAQVEAIGSALPAHSWLYYPPRQQLFRALQYTPFTSVKAIIIAMDPYPGRNSDNTPQACGIAFSCEKSVPDSMRNILQEVKRSYPDFIIPTTADLRPWCKEGVLLLNGSLTFLPIGDNSEQKRQQGLWEQFVHRIVVEVTSTQRNLGICMWGRDAQKYQQHIKGNHLQLTSSHPSPRSFASTDEPFKGCGHFSLINEYLVKNGKTPINWNLV